MSIPEGYAFRPGSRDDLDAVYAVVAAGDIADYGRPDIEKDDIRDEWNARPPEERVLVAIDSAGAIVAVANDTSRRPPRLRGHVHVHPEHRNHGLGTRLTRWVERRIANVSGEDADDATLEFQIGEVNTTAARLLGELGYERRRRTLRMERVLPDNEAPPLIDGVAVRAMRRHEEERAVHAALEDAFTDHWDNHPRTYEEFESSFFGGSWFDPSLSFVADDGGEIAGIALCTVFNEEAMGWIAWLGVRRQWRRRGVALAMLRHAFAEFDARGLTSAGLGVDAESLTGAPRVYERAGMRTTRSYAIYRKPVLALLQ
jgi:mycothiol synthase